MRWSFRLRPGATAERALLAEWGRCRWVWNQLVAESRDRHAAHREALAAGADPESLPTFGAATQDKLLTGWRAEHDWLRAGSSVAQQQTVRDFATARSKALQDRKNKLPSHRRRGLPRFKKRDVALPSLNFTQRGFRLKVDGDGRARLHLPGGITIPVVWSRDLPEPPTSARVHQDALGHWYVSFVVGVEDDPLPTPTDPRPLGIDWGIRQIATTTNDAFDLPHPEHGRRNAARLTRAQRKMARRRTPKGTPNTRGYEKAKREAARAHKKIARQRTHDANRWAKHVVTHHTQIAVEDFKPTFMAHNRHLSRKAADAAIATTKQALIWQATKHARDLRLINPAHTTMDCSNCAARTTQRIPLAERTYTCTHCGNVLDRDKNAATNMVVRAGFDPVDVEGISPEPAAKRELAA